MKKQRIMKWVAVCLGLLAVWAGIWGYRSGYDDGWSDGYRGGYNQAIIARQGVICTTIPHIQVNEISIYRDITDNVTIKYLDDGSGNPGLVVKWDGGVMVGDNATYWTRKTYQAATSTLSEIRGGDNTPPINNFNDRKRISDKVTTPITMIQRFEPWLREITGHNYNVSWER